MAKKKSRKKYKKPPRKKNGATKKERFHFIDREAQEKLWEGYEPFLRLIPDLVRTCKLVAAQTVDGLNKDSIEDRSIWGLLRNTFDDFHEICVLCANGLAQGADKILRGMFERTVTAW